MSLPVLVLGAGGHAKVLVEMLHASSSIIAGLVDPDCSLSGTSLLGVPLIGGDEVVDEFPPSEILLVNGLGSVGLPFKRQRLFDRFTAAGYRFTTVIHHSAIVASDVELGCGAQIMAGAIIQPGSRIGRNAIVNTRASVDHDCVIGDHTHVAPGVTLSGGVVVGALSHIGTGATVIQSIAVGENCLIGAGSVVLKNVPPGSTVVGVPARILNRQTTVRNLLLERCS